LERQKDELRPPILRLGVSTQGRIPAATPAVAALTIRPFREAQVVTPALDIAALLDGSRDGSTPPDADIPKPAPTPSGSVPGQLFESAPICAEDVLSAVPRWWDRRARAAGLSGRWTDWRRVLSLPPVSLDAPLLNLEDASAHALGDAYTRALDIGERLRHGRHYTPQLLSEGLWSELDCAGRPEYGAIVDPACGAGALLIPAVRRLLKASRATDAPAALLAKIGRGIRGIDSDPLAVWLGNAILAAELLPLWAALRPQDRNPLPEFLRVGDGLEPTDEAGITVMNPPYGRVRLSPADRERWERSLYGHANKFGVFLHAAVEMTAPGGLIGAVVPASFLGGAYYQRLRSLLAEEAPLVRCVFIGERSGVFATGVLQETCLAVFRRGGRQGGVACSVQQVNGRVTRQALGTVEAARHHADLPWLLPRSTRDVGLVQRASREPTRLSDYGWKASTGPLVWNRHKPQISATPGDESVPIVWAADLAGGRVTPGKERASQRWLRLRPRDSFMPLSEPGVLVQRTTAPEQPRRLVAALLDADALAREWGNTVVVENHVNVLRCTRADSPLSHSMLVALLSSDVLDRLYRCLTGTVAVSAYELAALPLPPEEVIRGWRDAPIAEIPRLAAEFYE
jgi:adenine-specific DNA-methyltransferase